MAGSIVSRMISRVVCMRVVFSAVFLGFLPGMLCAQSFGNHAFGNALSRHVITITGEITEGAATRFDRWLQDVQPEGYVVLFDGDGGDFKTGMALGQVIRANGFETEIGRVVQSENNAAPGRCLDACALAYLGGQTRRLSDRTAFGFQAVEGRTNQVAIGLTSPRIGAKFVSYLATMGVDARLYSAAIKGTQADPLSHRQTMELRVLTPTGFTGLSLIPTAKGIEARARRIGATRPFDAGTGMRLICAEAGAGDVWIALDTDNEASFAAYQMSQLDGMTIEITELGGRNQSFHMPPENIAIAQKETTQWRAPVDPNLTDALRRAILIQTRMNMPQSFGSVHTSHDLNQADRHTINAVLQHC